MRGSGVLARFRHGMSLSTETPVSLIAFHRCLIAAAILFCAGYGGYEVVRFVWVSGAGSLVLGAVFFVLAAGLSYYLWRLNRFLGYEE